MRRRRARPSCLRGRNRRVARRTACAEERRVARARPRAALQSPAATVSGRARGRRTACAVARGCAAARWPCGCPAAGSA
eukprot:3803254-Prymnesium_polylepis.1